MKWRIWSWVWSTSTVLALRWLWQISPIARWHPLAVQVDALPEVVVLGLVLLGALLFLGALVGYGALWAFLRGDILTRDSARHEVYGLTQQIIGLQAQLADQRKESIEALAEWKGMANRQIQANEKFRALTEEAFRAAQGRNREGGA